MSPDQGPASPLRLPADTREGAPADSASALRLQAAAEYVAAFHDTGLVPILVPRGHAPGDVIAASGEILSRRSDCFDTLDLRDEPSRLPNVELSWSAAARITLAATDIAEADARANAENLVAVRFEGVRSISTSRWQLQNRVRTSACPDLARALADGAIPAAEWLVIGEVLVAKPIVRLRRAQSGKASLSFLAGLAQRLGLTARAEGDLNRAASAELVPAEAAPVAFRPALVPVTPELAGRYRAAAPTGTALETFNPNDQAHRAVLDAWATRYAAQLR